MEKKNNTPCYKCIHRRCTQPDWLALDDDYICLAQNDGINPVTGEVKYKQCRLIAKDDCPHFKQISYALKTKKKKGFFKRLFS